MEKIIIFDTTLRDGEQAPGASLNQKEKLEIAHQLVHVGVDIIEAGFPVSSKGDFESVRLVASKVKGATICGLARCLKKDIDAAYQAIKIAKSNCRIHIFLATSKIHMKYKLKKTEDEVLKLAIEAVRYAKSKTKDVEFSAEDATRSEREFLYRIIERAIDEGATTVNIPDTVGYSDPEEFGSLISDIKNNVSNIDKAVISVHCHNDLGLAVANSLAAIKNGARQVECTINGIGERAGNASMEELVMAIKTRHDIFSGVDSSINTKELYKTSRLVSRLTGFVVAPNKAIVGLNAFRHESGIHQDGVLKEKQTYEIIKPQDVGFMESGIVLGKHSGRHAFSARLQSLGVKLPQNKLDNAFEKFKALADKKKTVYDEDLFSIVEEEIKVTPKVWQLIEFKVSSGTGMAPQAAIKLKSKGKIHTAISSGDGPVDACYKAIEKIIRIKAKLLDYHIDSVTSGKDALGEVNVKISAKNKSVIGRTASTDIIEASVKAYIEAINKIAAK
ncbi:MAG: 2-isopropylmalate synthase [Candidatus Omnitrophica bacterium]|nr:2-isopropylmalate synthase [Candidatus Omnitrophota bacterium]MDD5351821.1 2-isopropylmalate synthase [Candidatus Omnitrophota bacterium]MDD5550647.1 2-isopropylmalate synthase [Candidatus Omnitrophota bacterium]